ncbi:hypothetical protein [Burkholderia anthina]|uniref:hypothetical protein n=1 Tax=Burkholderia anthina TaxID=179879 RepID=UPI0037BEF1B2
MTNYFSLPFARSNNQEEYRKPKILVPADRGACVMVSGCAPRGALLEHAGRLRASALAVARCDADMRPSTFD